MMIRRDHRADELRHHFGIAVAETAVDEHDQSEEEEVLRAGAREHVGLEEAEAAEDDAADERPDGAVDRREHAEHEGKPGDERDLEEHEVRRVPGLGRGEHALLGFVAGHGECVGHDLAGVLALVLDLARAEGGELAAGLKLEADGRERVAREALHAVHDDREDGCGGKTGVKRGLLHHRGGHDAARERRDAGDDERAVDEERPTNQHRPTSPARPAIQMTTVFHCWSRRSRLKSVPMWVMRRKMATEEPSGRSFESRNERLRRPRRR